MLSGGWKPQLHKQNPPPWVKLVEKKAFVGCVTAMQRFDGSSKCEFAVTHQFWTDKTHVETG
ncbi:MAG: hypothetical protein VKN72_03010 [Nostocales cyanobacterium 94392]|nr:hypothetical protein [Nostocales cyanobacterium 94392]